MRDCRLQVRYIDRRGRPFMVREGRESDATALWRYKDRIFRETEFLLQGAEDFHSDDEQEALFLRRFRVSPNSIYLVAQVDRRIIGTLSLYGGHFKRNRHVGHIGMGVLEEYWGLGVGGALIDQGIEWARGSSIIEKLVLHVYNTNERAMRLYLRRGFEREAVLKREVRLDDGSYVDLIVMARSV